MLSRREMSAANTVSMTNNISRYCGGDDNAGRGCGECDTMETEKLITGKYAHDLWQRMIKGIAVYNLIEPGDNIAVCVSGGKDSMLLAKMMQMAASHQVYDIRILPIMLDAGFDKAHRDSVITNCKKLGIELNIISAPIFDDVKEAVKDGGSLCFFCSRMRRGYLYRKAAELGCNKIALGHHRDDVIETTLMSMLYGAQISTMLPKLKSDNVEGMQLIRPMYLIHEKNIISWTNDMGLDFTKCSCSLTSIGKEEDTTRLRVKKLIAQLSIENPHVKDNIFGSMQKYIEENM